MMTKLYRGGAIMSFDRVIPDDAMIFGLLLIISNRMDTLLERELREFDVTAKQWFLSETVNSLFDLPPTLKEVANAMASSHQNVKQVAMKLQQKGLLTLVRDKKDARVTRLRMTEQSKDFWKQTDLKGSAFRERMFKGMDPEEIARTRQLLERMLLNLAEMENAVIDSDKDTQ